MWTSAQPASSGRLASMATNPQWHVRRAGTTGVGLGTAPEGIEQNPVVYDLVNELPFRSACQQGASHAMLQ